MCLPRFKLALGRTELTQTLATAQTFSDNQDIPTLVFRTQAALSASPTPDLHEAFRAAITADELLARGEFADPQVVARSETLPRVKRTLALVHLAADQVTLAETAARQALERRRSARVR